ncbi:MAG: heparinase II/III family protein [Verrucomicrobiales bacterium]|nr:heparinase II/III family protein [Verrucomicrobiales bacterium]
MQTQLPHYRLRRLGRMSLREILSRSVEYGWRHVESVFPGMFSHWAQRTADLAGGDRGRSSKDQPLPLCLGSPGSSHLEFAAFQALFQGRDAELCSRAEAIGAGSVRLFGEVVSIPRAEMSWHLDWKAGKEFPVDFRGRVALLPGGTDAKRVWEFNRHQFLVTLGQAYLLTGREVYAERAVQLMQSWILSNRPFRGVNWGDALEVGIRLLPWLWTLRLIESSPALDAEAVRRIVTSVVLQRDYVRRHLSLYSSPNTHLLGEALALFVAGLALPELRGSRSCVRLGQRILEQELMQQVGDDGSHSEKSAYYHCYALEMYLLATILGQQHGVAFSSLWMRRVERMAEFLMYILRPDGSLARFGDDDGGKTLRLCNEDYYDSRSLLAVAALVFSRGDFKFVAGKLPEEIFWLFGAEGVRKYESLAAAEPPSKGVRWFSDAQVAVARTGWSDGDSWLLAQGQPMGMLTAGHSHASPLSFELFMKGQPIVVDPGTYSYADEPWRNYFRSEQAHNTVIVDDAPWLSPAGPFRWNDPQSLSPARMQETSPAFMLTLVHPNGSYQHQRRFEWSGPCDALIEDEIVGTGRRRFAFWLHFPPNAQIRMLAAEQLEIVSGALTVRLDLQGFAKPVCTIHEGETHPIQGWFSPGFDRKAPAPALCIEDEGDLPARRRLRFSAALPPT